MSAATKPWLTRPARSGLTVEQRFWEKVYQDPEAGCWLWQGTIGGNGYGHIGVRGKLVKAHRLSYELANGAIPEGLTIDHLCRVRHCVNPEHLEAVTFAENCLRGEGLPARNARKTHCPKGHEYTPENTYVDPKGYRDCRECGRERQRRRYATDPQFKAQAKARATKSKGVRR